ncbi:MAG: hypothetical protein ACREUP_08990 [Burkholderiales bacterium]
MRTVLALAAAAEGATGIVLFAYPPIVVRLLLGAEIGDAGEVVSRVAGMALICLGVACWPSRSTLQPLYAMLIYGVLAALYLAYVGLIGEGGGVLLWPAVAAHAIIVALLLRARSGERSKSAGGTGE